MPFLCVFFANFAKKVNFCSKKLDDFVFWTIIVCVKQKTNTLNGVMVSKYILSLPALSLYINVGGDR